MVNHIIYSTASLFSFNSPSAMHNRNGGVGVGGSNNNGGLAMAAMRT